MSVRWPSQGDVTEAELTAALALKQSVSEKGEASGYAALDADGRVLDGSGVPVESTGAVDSVNGQTGVVVLDAGDVGADPAGSAAAAQAASQPADADLTAIAALSTTAFGRAVLALADAAAGRTAFGLGTAAVAASTDFDAAGAAAAAQAASQPLDSDLTALAALTTTSFGRSLLELANAAAARTALDVPATGDLAAKAPLASPTFTGDPKAPTPAQGDNDTSIATTAYVQTEAGLLLPKSLVDAKGDLLAGTADNTVGRLAVGTDGDVLVADSSKTAGLGYETRARRFTRVASGSYMVALGVSAGTIAVPNNSLRAGPIFVDTASAIDRIGLEVTTAGASSALRLGIYSSTTGGLPDVLLHDFGTVDSSTTGVKEITVAVTLVPGKLWLVAQAEGGAPTIRTVGGFFTLGWNPISQTDATGGTNTGVSKNITAGSLAASFGAGGLGASQVPRIHLRAA